MVDYSRWVRPSLKIFEYAPVGDWDYDELGTDKIHTPNFSSSELGTKKILVPNSYLPELGTKKIPVPNSDDWQLPIGCLQQKWIKDHQYWYWRYYKLNGKKRSLYLHKDYNKAIRKAIKIGTPPDAKLPKPKCAKTDPQIQTARTENLIDLAQTAHGASRSNRAA